MLAAATRSRWLAAARRQDAARPSPSTGVCKTKADCCAAKADPCKGGCKCSEGSSTCACPTTCSCKTSSCCGEPAH